MARLNVVVGVLMNRTNEVLIAQRPPTKSFAGFWEFPGGKIEPQETPPQALLRELHEELGIKIDLKHTTLLGNVEYAYPDFYFCAPVFLCAGWQKEPQPLEGQQLSWVKFGELFSYPLLPACEKILPLIPLSQIK